MTGSRTTSEWLPRMRGKEGEEKKGRLDGVSKKSGIKLTVYSLQNAVCCSAVIFHEGLPCGAEWVRSPGEGANNGTLYRAPGAQSQHPYIIIHTGKKAGGTFTA